MLSLKNLCVSVKEKQILQDVSLQFEAGKVYALMGPNGSGKSTLSSVIMGHPKYTITSGSCSFEGENICELSPEERAKKGIFLSFQYPMSIPGVSLSNFLRTAYQAKTGEKIRVFQFNKKLKSAMQQLDIPESFASRHLNVGFSGGEKKKTEMLQALLLDPKLIIMDETDSGLDVDALKTVAEGVKQMRTPDKAIVLITHYFRILHYLTPDIVYVLKDGKLVDTGGPELAKQIEEEGFKHYGDILNSSEEDIQHVKEAITVNKNPEKTESSSPFDILD